MFLNSWLLGFIYLRAEINQDALIFLSGLSRSFPAIIANVASYKIIMIIVINLLMHINIPKRD